MKKKRSTTEYTWRFFRSGGFDQVRLDSAQDLLNLDKLDQKLWVALSCPVENVHFDSVTLSLIDSDGDKRIRVRELIAAIKWTAQFLKNPDELISCSDGISVDSINDASVAGKKLKEALQNSLNVLGKDDSGKICVADIQKLEKNFSEKEFNGDGIITIESTTDESLKILIQNIISISGSVIDRSGKPGINDTLIEDFHLKALEFHSWMQESGQNKSLNPLAESTSDAIIIFLDLKDKIDDFFARCEIATYDDRFTMNLKGNEITFTENLSKNITLENNELANLPIAQIKSEGVLPLLNGINPAWKKKILTFKEKVVKPLLGPKDSILLSEWLEICSIFEPRVSWQKRKPQTSIDSLGTERVREILSRKRDIDLYSLVQKDKAVSQTFESINDLNKLVRFCRDLFPLCRNFVNFSDFYSKGSSAIFQAGTLYLDRRSCNLCVRIDDPNKHSLMAAMAGTYLVYCECKRKDEPKSIVIVSAFTSGDSDNLLVGRNGIFYDRNGKDWDATIIKIIDNPISIRQAFWLPYKNFVRMIEAQVAKRAVDAETQSSSKLTQAATLAVHADKSKPELQTPPKKFDIGVVAALGVAAGALGTFVATIFGYIAGIIKLGPLAVIGALIGLITLISGPSIVLAYIKLRKRNLGPILDAGGWAINAKAQISVPFGAQLTHIASLPPGSQKDLFDPYAEKKSPWLKIAIVLLFLYISYLSLDNFGFVNKWSNGWIGTKNKSLIERVDINSVERPFNLQKK